MLELVRALGGARGRPSEKADPIRSSLPQEQTAPTHDLNVLRQRLRGLVASIDPEDEAAVRAVRRPLLQAIVLWEFGSDFRQDPEFGPMLDGIERTLMADPAAHGRFSHLVRHLKE